MKDILIPRPVNDSAFHDTKVTRYKKSVSDNTSGIIMSENDILEIRLNRISELEKIIEKYKKLFSTYVNSEDSKRDNPKYGKDDEIILSICKEYYFWKTQYTDILNSDFYMEQFMEYTEIRFKEVLDILSWKLIVGNKSLPQRKELFRTIKGLEEAA